MSWSASRQGAAASRRYTNTRTGDYENAEAEQALVALESWASPRLGTAAAAPFQYERSPIEWMKRTLDQVDEDDQEPMDLDDDDDEQEEALRQAPGAARGRLATPRVLERADTPVMSNSSKKATTTTPQTRSPAVNIQSPFVPAIYTPTASRAAVLPRATPLSRTYVQECRLYHDALRIFRQEKISVMERFDRSSVADSSRVSAAEEGRLEQDFLQALQYACLARTAPLPVDPLAVNPMKDPARKEGNFWSLLSHLRRLGVQGLLYAGTDAREVTRQFVSEQAQRVEATPFELSQTMVGPKAPLCMQRWACFVAWLEDCHNRVLPTNIARPRPGGGTTVDDCLPGSQRQPEVLKAALNLVMAGRLDDAIDMAAKSNLEYLAAQWSGGTPAGKSGNQMTGNPRRPLWQALMWKKAELEEKTTPREDVALAALLSNHVSMALKHPSLRTWERALYTLSRAVVSRWQDEMSLQHNQNRRQARPPYPGTEWEDYEEQNLQNSSNIKDMTEGQMIREIMSTPFDEMRDEDPYSTAMVAFWIGESFVQSYMDDWYNALAQNDEDYVRFMAHLALYLDSLTLGGSPQTLSGVDQWKNGCVKRYLDLLASREELWHMVVLYAAFLPTSEILKTLPSLLVPIDSQPARKELLRQMEDFLAPGLDREILLLLARLTLEEVDFTEDLLRPTALDDKKMRAVLWFSLRQDLVADGLLYANRLLRQFLLDDKITAANHFVSDIRPAEIADFFEEASRVVGDDTRLPVDADGNALMALDHEAADEHIKEARREHAALLAYLHAEQSMNYWKAVLGRAEAVPPEVDDPIDKSHLNEVEAVVAQSEERRKLAEEKRSASHKVTVAANEALEQLDAVLKFAGGWLLVEEHSGNIISDEEKAHRDELERLRSKVIPSIIRQYREVCMETADWMSKSLYDGMKRLDKGAMDVLLDLDKSNPPKESALAPSYWTKRALTVVDAATTETYDCLGVVKSTTRREILSLMAETMVVHLKYTSDVGLEETSEVGMLEG